jgi:hypothetical protein
VDTKTQIVALLLAAAAVVVPAVSTFLVAWFRAKTAALAVVRQAVQETEAFASSRPDVTGAEKRELALSKIRKDPRTDIDDQRATQLIERVLPEVRRDSESPTPRLEIRPPGGPRLEESASGLPTPKRPR